MTLTRLLSLGAMALIFIGCAGDQEVPRRNGETLEWGRHIPPQAYAWYARGLHFERTGQYSAAEEAYAATLDHDVRSAPAWAALVRVQCRESHVQARTTANRGLRVALRKAPIFSARGRCLLALAEAETDEKRRAKFIRLSLADGQAAIADEPAYEPGNRVYVEALQLNEEKDKAHRVWRAFLLFADEERLQVPEASSVDAALAEENLLLARSLAVPDLPPGALATRALAWGKHSLAREQATLVHRANPKDADAAIVLSILGESSPTSTAIGTPSPLAIVLFAAHLRRNVDDSAAKTFLEAHQDDLRDTSDPLVLLLLKRLSL